uniref:Uncharacterized protein n=1 Tax=Rhizophora mucronata TaxID=61149 RepID=A0A2P2PK55_RHIMU
MCRPMSQFQQKKVRTFSGQEMRRKRTKRLKKDLQKKSNLVLSLIETQLRQN